MKKGRRKNSYLGFMIVIGTFTMLLFILIAAIVILFVTSRFSTAQTTEESPTLVQQRTPLDAIEADQVDPALALASLGGLTAEEIIAEALDKARPETALAAILYHPTLNDRETAGYFLLLSQTYLENDNEEKAIFSYRLAGTVAILSPTIPDTIRADILIETGEGLRKQEERELAKFYFDQLFTLAAESGSLQAAHRRAIFERLQKNYIMMGHRELARRSLNLSARPLNSASIQPREPILPVSAPIALPEAIQEVEAERWRRAQELAAILVERGDRTPPRESVEALRASLLEEDQQKLSFYEEQLTQAARLSKQIDVALARIEWLSIKYRVARRAYGLSLVPEWEDQTEQIRADLTKAYENLFALYADLIVALPELSQIERATEEKLRREILAGELGRYPNYPAEPRRRQLLEATARLIETQPELNIFIGSDNEDHYIFISPDN